MEVDIAASSTRENPGELKASSKAMRKPALIWRRIFVKISTVFHEPKEIRMS
jgi:hypothetical protein